MKRITSILLIAAMLLCVLPVFTAAAATSMEVYKCKEYVTLRKTMSTKADDLDWVNLGETVTNCAVKGDTWIRCEYNGQTGYILSKYLNVPGCTAIANQKVVNCQKNVTLRKTPSKSAGAAAIVPKGAKVTQCYEVPGPDANGDSWIWCEYNGKCGYILAQYLQDYSSGSAATEEALSDQMVVNCNEWVSLRETKSTSAKVLNTIPLGAVVTNCTKIGKWVKCEYDGDEGYVLASYLADESDCMKVHDCDYVSLRKSKSSSSSCLIKVPANQIVSNCSLSGAWMKCSYKGKTGYIANPNKYLTTP